MQVGPSRFGPFAPFTAQELKIDIAIYMIMAHKYVL